MPGGPRRIGPDIGKILQVSIGIGLERAEALALRGSQFEFLVTAGGVALL